LTKNHRLAAFGLVVALLGLLFVLPATSPNTSSAIKTLAFSAILLLAFTVLLLEPFFTRPTDVIAAGLSILLLLAPSRDLLAPWGIWYWLVGGYAAGAVTLATAALLLLSTEHSPNAWRNRVSAVLKQIVTYLAPGRAQYFFVFILTLLFFVPPATIPFVSLSLFTGLVVLIDPQKIGLAISRAIEKKDFAVGTLLGVQGPNTFLIRLGSAAVHEPLCVGDLLEFRYGMDPSGRIRRAIALEQFHLDDALWVRALCHPEIEKRAETIPLLPRHEKDRVYSRSRDKVSAFLDDVVGVVQEGSEIGSLRFQRVGKGRAMEGDLVQVPFEGGAILYQVVNARVNRESLSERNQADVVVGEAIQLGRWDPARAAFDRFGWVPDARLPVTRAKPESIPSPAEDEVELGKIPGTDFPVLLNRHEAITHHTAVLGVTGAGKSVFSRHLIRQLVADPQLRVIVVDFTREWKARLRKEAVGQMIDDALSQELWKAIDVIDDEMAKFKNQRDKDVLKSNKKILRDGFEASLTAFLKGDEPAKIFELPEVSQIEGVLEYTQWFFTMLFHIARTQKCFGRRVCVVLEEAHTVIPEWNFVGIADKGAQALVNNISQIALQGRKYGIGFVVIAQRTATVSKTVLTQCNTIIAFQCFDATSIEFLSNYLPKAVAEALPNLRFRRAVAFGKAVRGSVPLMFDVPEIDEPELVTTA
jgi:hypothetical protein